MSIIYAAVIAFLMIFSVAFRRLVVGALTTGGYLVQGVWNRMPSWETVKKVFLIPWLIFFIVMLALGYYGRSPWGGFLFGIFFPPWCLLFIGMKWSVIKKIAILPFIVITVFLSLAAPGFFMGIWSPEIKGSWDRWVDDKKSEITNSLDKQSLKTEPEMGVFARVAEDTVGVNEEGQPVKEMEAGIIVKVNNLNGKKATKENEGLIFVMFPNKLGHFIKGQEAYIPTRLLDWDWQRKTKFAIVKTEVAEESNLARQQSQSQQASPIVKQSVPVQSAPRTEVAAGVKFTPADNQRISGGGLEYDLSKKFPDLHIGETLVLADDFSVQIIGSKGFVVLACNKELLSNEKYSEFVSLKKGTEVTVNDPMTFGLYSTGGLVIVKKPLVLTKK